MNEQIKEELSLIIEESKISEYPIDFRIEINRLVKKGYLEGMIRYVLKESFSCYIDDYGLIRRIIPNKK